MTSRHTPIRAHRVAHSALGVSLLLVPGSFVSGQTRAVRAGRHFDHVVVVVMENEGAQQALADPNVAALVKQGAWFNNYHALSHPSQPNYLALIAGSTFGIDHDHTPAPIREPSIVERLEAKGLTWKAYAEDYPGGCYLGSAAGKGYLTPKATPTELYARKHVPFLAFAAIQGNPRRCSRVVNAREFMLDARAGALPNYAFYSPNMFNDGHDTPLETSTIWLRKFVDSLRGTAGMRKRTLLMITWDEGGGDDLRSNRVLAIVLGNGIVPGRYSERLTHYSLLRTIEDNFGLQPVADGDANADPLPPKIWRD
ncbi:MAG TPA: alkaline phosphatase family protein [Gemmatimonadaceae bacterium]